MTEDGGRLTLLDAQAARRWAVATRAAFAAHRAEMDDLNVFPVPDGDTGTNLFNTLDSGLDAARELSGGGSAAVVRTLADEAAVLARATLLAARGSSGVILSQLVQGLSEVIAEAATSSADASGAGGWGAGGVAFPRTEAMNGLDGPTLAKALRRASDRAHAGMSRPVEGTILSVAASAARAAELAAAPDSSLYSVAHASLAAARTALAATTTQLPVLARAGVVDAGGLGYVLILEALEMVVSGTSVAAAQPGHTARLSQVALRTAAHADRGEVPGPGAPAYEVMYLLSDSDVDAVDRLRVRLDGLGDSVLVVGAGDLWNVHVHADDVGGAIQAGIEAGRPHRIAVTHFCDQARARSEHSAVASVASVASVANLAPVVPRVPVVPVVPVANVTVVACAAGGGLAWVFSAAGAVPVFSGPGRRASAGQLLNAIRSAGSGCVIVLPNDTQTLLAAEAAASAAADQGPQVYVVGTRSAVQGIAALAVFDPAASGLENQTAMNRAAAETRYGGVSVAGKELLTKAGRCQPGDVLGEVDGEVVVIGHDLAVVGAEVVTRLLAGGGELLTVVSGAGGGPDLSAVVVQSAHAGRHDLHVTTIEGGQATYPLWLGVE